MSGIFINYRGDDCGTAAALIDRGLREWFGGDQVFLDCRSLEVGADFTEEIVGRLRSCSVLLVVMGPRWLTLTDGAGGRRIDDPADWVRCEITQALGRRVRVIPVLLDGTTLPAADELPEDLRPLGRRQHVVLRHRYVDVDLAALAGRIVQVEPELARSARAGRVPPGPVPVRPGRSRTPAPPRCRRR
jgi:hypothetical protein